MGGRDGTEMVRTTRTLPHNLIAEESLLGAMLLSRDAVAVATELITVEHFYRPANAHIFGAIAKLYGDGERPDPVSVAETLRRADLLDAIGGPATLTTLLAEAPAISNVPRYAKIIFELASLRSMIAMAGEIAELGYSLPDDVESAIDQVEAMVFRFAQRKELTTMQSLDDALKAQRERIERLYEAGEAVVGLSSGFLDLDEMLLGLQPGKLYIVGARPAMGKTSFALGMVSHAVMSERTPALVFSLEMSNPELTDRLVGSEARIESQKLRNGRFNEKDWVKYDLALEAFAGAPLVIDDNPNVTVTEMRSKARRVKAQMGLGLVVVDYVQLMTGRSAENRQTEIAEISRGLKILARELEVPVVALAQLNRSLEQRAEKRPMLSDLRESGALEQDADVVMFLYRDEVYNADTQDQGIAEVIIAKHRAGPTGTVKLAWLGQYTKFANMAKG